VASIPKPSDACAERSGDQQVISYLHNNAGVLELAMEDLDAARAHLDKALRAMRAIGEESAMLMVNFGWLDRAERDFEGARRSFGEGMRIGRRNGDRLAVSVAILGLACRAADLGQYDRAARLHGAAEATLAPTGLDWGAAYPVRRDSIHQVRSRMVDKQFERAYAVGRTLSVQDALDLAAGSDHTTPISA
jgi:tetratricopeptide (TPR) repeat protein